MGVWVEPVKVEDGCVASGVGFAVIDSIRLGGSNVVVVTMWLAV